MNVCLNGLLSFLAVHQGLLQWHMGRALRRTHRCWDADAPLVHHCVHICHRRSLRSLGSLFNHQSPGTVSLLVKLLLRVDLGVSQYPFPQAPFEPTGKKMFLCEIYIVRWEIIAAFFGLKERMPLGILRGSIKPASKIVSCFSNTVMERCSFTVNKLKTVACAQLLLERYKQPLKICTFFWTFFHF